MWEKSDLFSPLFFLSKLPPSENAEKKNRRISSVFKNLELKMHAKNTHARARAYEFSGAFRSRDRRYVRASDHKTLSFFLFFCVFFNQTAPVCVRYKKKGTK